MRCSISVVTAAILLCTSFVHAGGTDRGRMSMKAKPVSYHRYGGGGVPCGCEVRGCEVRGCEVRGCDSRDCAGPICQTSCSPTCCPRLLPAIFNQIDCLLEHLFCDPCNIPTCRPRAYHPSACCTDIWMDYAPRCGCNGGGSDINWNPQNTTDPFVDDELKAPPQPPKDVPAPKEARMKKTAPKSRPVEYRQPRPASKTALVEPVRLSEEVSDENVAKVAAVSMTKSAPESTKAEPLHFSDEPSEVTNVAAVPSAPRQKLVEPKLLDVNRSVQPVKHETSARRVIPKNPLRDE